MRPFITVHGLAGNEACLESLVRALTRAYGGRSPSKVELTLQARRYEADPARCTLVVRSRSGTELVVGEGLRLGDAVEQAIRKLVSHSTAHVAA